MIIEQYQRITKIHKVRDILRLDIQQRFAILQEYLLEVEFK